MKKLISMLAFMVAIFTVGCSDGGEDIPVETKLSISTSAITVEADGGGQSVYVMASGQWTISGNVDWCTPSMTSGSGDGQVTFNVAENTSTDDRKATFTFACGDKSVALVITQKQKNELIVTSSKFEVEAEGGEVQIEVKANVNFEYVIDESAKDWITYEGTRAMKTSTLTFKITENDNTEKREGKITIKSGGISEIISVCQDAAAPVLNVTESYEVDYNDTELNIEFESNLECVVTIPEDCEWISIADDTRAIGTHSIKLSITQNTSINSRTANISIHDTEKTVSKTIAITQGGETHFDVNLSEAGLLSSYITKEVKYKLESLKVSGLLNGDDICIIREMAGVNHLGEKTEGKLAILDLTDAKIVEGGSAYYYPSNPVFKTAYTKNATIGRFMFAGCRSLTKLILPVECIEIEERGVEDCENLIDIVIFNNVKYIREWAFNNCAKVTTLNLPNSITDIDKGAFHLCQSLKSINLPNSITRLSESIFFNCPALESIIIPESVITVEGNAFAYCSNLKEIVFPDSMERFTGSGVFYECNSLYKIVMGKNFKGSVYPVFDYKSCTSIKELHCKALVPPECSFSSHFYEATLFIPKDAYEAYTSHQSWVRFKNIESVY